MPRLLNRKREQFAELRAGGMPRLEAMEKAGYKASAANARRLDNSVDIRNRVAELYRLHGDFVSADIARVMIEQARIAYSNIADFWEATEDGGLRLKDLSKLPRELTACIREIKIGKDGEPTIKLHDKPGALQALQRYLDPDPLPPEDRRRPAQVPAPMPAPEYTADDSFAELIHPTPQGVQ